MLWKNVIAGLVVLLAAAPGALAQQTPAIPQLPEGIVGEFQPPTTGKGLLVVYLGGSEGGVPRGGARDLNEQGFGVLALAYFKAGNLPATLESIPLEYFDRAINWLAAQPSNAGRRVAVVGISKGAEAALLAATRNPQVCAVVAGAPSSVVWQGVNPQNPMISGPSWTLNGEPVGFSPYDSSAPFISIRDLYGRSYAKAKPETEIPVERVQGPVLLISGRQDAVWPSTEMGDALVKRAERMGKERVEHLAYDGAGHAAFGKPAPSVAAIPPAVVAQAGGSAEGNQNARLTGWSRTKDFLDQAREKDC